MIDEFFEDRAYKAEINNELKSRLQIKKLHARSPCLKCIEYAARHDNKSRGRRYIQCENERGAILLSYCDSFIRCADQ